MKKVIALVLALAVCGSAVLGCKSTTTSTTTTTAAAATTTAAATTAAAETTAPAGPAEITVVTSYGGDDGNRANYEAAVAAYEKATGNKVNDASGTSNEEWKAKIMADFETGAEPDVLFYFNGVDANDLVNNGKVVSIDTIRAEYPDYASNMKDDLIPASPADGQKYAVPVNGYWEGLYVNKAVLEDCGVKVPGADYTWDQFLADCEVIKTAGYTPIACSLAEVPHYWFEYSIFNHDTVATHNTLPASSTDTAGAAWVSGLNDIKSLYELGYFPTNTLTSTDAETFQLMADNKAAFAIDGSWKIGWFQENAADINDFTVTYVHAQNERKATDLIGGLSMGYYITEKAWNDPEKREACVKFVEAMTQDDVVSLFGATAVTALKSGTTAPTDADSLVVAALAMTKAATGVASAVQDNLNQTARTELFSGSIKKIVTGSMTAQAAVDAALAIKE